MSLIETSVLSIVETQYYYKMKANAGMFFTLLAAQLLALIISLNGVSSMSTGYDGMHYTLKYISGDIMIMFTLIWAFVIGISMAVNSFRSDFTFVTNRLSSNLSSMAFLGTAAALGGVTATLGGVLLRVISFFTYGGADISSGFYIAPLLLLVGITVTALYAILLSTAGYFAGMLIQRNGAFIVILPGLFIGTLIVEGRSAGGPQLLTKLIPFFSQESSLPLFAVKVLIVSLLILGSVILFSDRMEVRK